MNIYSLKCNSNGNRSTDIARKAQCPEICEFFVKEMQVYENKLKQEMSAKNEIPGLVNIICSYITAETVKNKCLIYFYNMTNKR